MDGEKKRGEGRKDKREKRLAPSICPKSTARSALRAEKQSEDGCWNGLLGAGIFRHHFAETAMRGLARHDSSLFPVPLVCRLRGN